MEGISEGNLKGHNLPSLSIFLYRRRQSPTVQAKRRDRDRDRSSSSNSTCCRRSPCLTLLCLSFRVASEPVSVSSLGGDDPLTRRDLSAVTSGEVRAGPKPEGFGPPTDVTTRTVDDSRALSNRDNSAEPPPPRTVSMSSAERSRVTFEATANTW